MYILTGLCDEISLKECLEISKSRSINKLIIFFVCACIIVPLAVYFFIQIRNIYNLYKVQQENESKLKLASIISTPDIGLGIKSSSLLGSSVLSSDNDNYEASGKNTVDTSLVDEHDQISKTIQKSFDGYKEYNNILEKYYSEKKQVAPNIIDKSVLSANNDNW